MQHLRLAGWKTEAGRQEYLAAYDAALALWTAPYEKVEISTRFGPTGGVVSGPPDAPPLFLLPAATGIGAIQWYPNAGRLAADHRVYALDFVAGPGGGTQTQQMIDRYDYAAWLTDVLDGLGLDRARFIGSSQGGWFVLNLCVAEPDRVEAAALLAPAASLAPFSTMTSISLRLPMPPGWVAKPALRAVVGPSVDIDDRVSQVMAMGLKHFRYQERAVFPDVFSDTALRRVTSPVLVMVGDREIIYEPQAAVARAAHAIPNVETELVPGARHLLNVQMPELVNERILRFLAAATPRVGQPAPQEPGGADTAT